MPAGERGGKCPDFVPSGSRRYSPPPARTSVLMNSTECTYSLQVTRVRIISLTSSSVSPGIPSTRLCGA